jgi:hypothetical protein
MTPRDFPLTSRKPSKRACPPLQLTIVPAIAGAAPVRTLTPNSTAVVFDPVEQDNVGTANRVEAEDVRVAER